MNKNNQVETPKFNRNGYLLSWEEVDGEEWVDNIDHSEISTFSQAAHKRDTIGYDLSQNALCLDVIGAITLIIGALFIVLSLSKKRNVIQGINFASLQFVICACSLLAGLVLLTLGTIKLIKALRIRKEAKRDISYLSILSKK